MTKVRRLATPPPLPIIAGPSMVLRPPTTTSSTFHAPATDLHGQNLAAGGAAVNNTAPREQAQLATRTPAKGSTALIGVAR